MVEMIESYIPKFIASYRSNPAATIFYIDRKEFRFFGPQHTDKDFYLRFSYGIIFYYLLEKGWSALEKGWSASVGPLLFGTKDEIISLLGPKSEEEW